jgi:4'-phosphopantetheinyl transferase
MNNKVSLYIYRFLEEKTLVPTAWLDKGELESFSKMSSAKRRTEFLNSRFLIKSILSNVYQITEPRILKNAKGKPYVTGIKFNISHSQDCLVLAVSKDSELGVDVELSEGKRFFGEIAQQYFSDKECATIFSSSSLTKQQKVFKRLWALKEAYVKAFNGVVSKKSLAIHFDLPKKNVDKAPTSKSITFFLNEKLNVALCVVKKIKTSDLDVYEVKNVSSQDSLPELKVRKSPLKFIRIS